MRVPKSLRLATLAGAAALAGCSSLQPRPAPPRLDQACNLVLDRSRATVGHDAMLEYQSYAPVDSVFEHSVAVLQQRGFQPCSVDRAARTAVFQPEPIQVEGVSTHLLLRLSVARNTYGSTGQLAGSWGIRQVRPGDGGSRSFDDPALRYVAALRDELARGLR